MIKLAIFDMDGTIVESYLNWKQIREELGVEEGGNILKEIYRGEQTNKIKLDILEKYEKENTLKTKPIHGILDFLFYLKSRNILTALITNNNFENTDFLIRKFNLNFDRVITREMKLWKPDPDAFLYVMKSYNCAPCETISIGDSHYDVRASMAAGISQIYNIKNFDMIQLERSNIIYFDDYLNLRVMIEEKRFF
ncbi:MAG: HAD family hydrolase [Candidatus Omnitrophota bacterium]